MLSSVFVDRPRLAIVISIVITIAGLIAIKALPVAQFPEIVPPQVEVSATYPGAGSGVVEETVAQPIESEVVGVDNMLYMKSTSGNDGSYTLIVTFAVGTDPDTNTVNVQNWTGLAEAKLPDVGQAYRRQCQEEILGTPPSHQFVLTCQGLRRAVPVELRDDQHPRQRQAGARRR